MTRLTSFVTRRDGQSLVEIALALPLLLIVLLGVVDVGRAYTYTTSVTNAAREAAFYGSKQATPTSSPSLGEMGRRACNETGLDGYLTSTPSVSGLTATCPSGTTVVASSCSANSGDVNVEVSYQFNLVSGYLFQSILGRNTLTARGTACFRSLAQ